MFPMSAMIDLGVPARGLAFIKHIETVETYGNSPIIVTPKTRDAIARCQFVVVAVGQGEACDDDDCERRHQTEHTLRIADGAQRWLRVHPEAEDIDEGDWVLCRHRSWDVTPDPSVFVVKVDDVLGKFVEGPEPPTLREAADRLRKFKSSFGKMSRARRAEFVEKAKDAGA